MLNAISELIASYFLSITIYIFLAKIKSIDVHKIGFKDIFIITILAVIIAIIHSTEYSTLNPLIIFFILTFGQFYVYKVNLTKSILCASIFIIILFFADLIATIIFAGIATLNDVREMSVFVILANSVVGMITLSLINIKAFRTTIINVLEKLEKKNSIEIITFILLLISALSLVFYLLSLNYTYNSTFVTMIITVLLFIILTSIFFKEKYEKEIIIHNYDQLFEYVKTFEEWIDTENMNIHESKNQLATLRDIVKDNKEATEYIDNIISERINVESNNIIKLKNIPKGGLKGLLFYKITLAEKQKIDLLIDISNNVSSSLKKLNLDETKNLCRLVGIFFDNAIEAAKETKKKKISLEIYLNDDCLNIVISNTYTGNIEINKIKENGYSTKGKNRGRGLYLANKFSNKTNNFKLESRIINNYYIQKIIIKKEH